MFPKKYVLQKNSPKNIFEKNISKKIFFPKLFFEKILLPNIFPKKVGVKPPCCPQGLGWYRALARSQPSISLFLYTLLTPIFVALMMRIPDMAAMWLGWTEIPPTSILSFVINSSRFFTCFLSLARRFWNQIFTWEVVKYLIKRGDRVGKNDFFQHIHLNILSYIWQLSRIIYFIHCKNTFEHVYCCKFADL